MSAPPDAPGQRRRGGARTRLIGPLWRWHRRAGLAAALVVLLLASSGLLLNHSDALGLDRYAVETRWVYALYGDRDTSPVLGFRAGSHWVLQGADGRIHLDDRALAACAGSLIGAIERTPYLLIACQHELLVLDDTGQRIDALGSASGLDGAITGVASDTDVVLIRIDATWQRFDPDGMTLAPEPGTPAMVQQPSVPPAAIRERAGPVDAWLDWERLLLDLHSGRLFGRFGTLVVDITGVLAIVLALSGVLIWGLRRRRP